jgi:hypothetical protein
VAALHATEVTGVTALKTCAWNEVKARSSCPADMPSIAHAQKHTSARWATPPEAPCTHGSRWQCAAVRPPRWQERDSSRGECACLSRERLLVEGTSPPLQETRVREETGRRGRRRSACRHRPWWRPMADFCEGCETRLLAPPSTAFYETGSFPERDLLPTRYPTTAFLSIGR